MYIDAVGALVGGESRTQTNNNLLLAHRQVVTTSIGKVVYV